MPRDYLEELLKQEREEQQRLAKGSIAKAKRRQSELTWDNADRGPNTSKRTLSKVESDADDDDDDDDEQGSAQTSLHRLSTKTAPSSRMGDSDSESDSESQSEGEGESKVKSDDSSENESGSGSEWESTSFDTARANPKPLPRLARTSTTSENAVEIVVKSEERSGDAQETAEAAYVDRKRQKTNTTAPLSRPLAPSNKLFPTCSISQASSGNDQRQQQAQRSEDQHATAQHHQPPLSLPTVPSHHSHSIRITTEPPLGHIRLKLQHSPHRFLTARMMKFVLTHPPSPPQTPTLTLPSPHPTLAPSHTNHSSNHQHQYYHQFLPQVPDKEAHKPICYFQIVVTYSQQTLRDLVFAWHDPSHLQPLATSTDIPQDDRWILSHSVQPASSWR
jgi:hypothetical protein